MILYVHKAYSFVSSLGSCQQLYGVGRAGVIIFIIMPSSFPFLCIRIPISGNLQLAYIASKQQK